MTEQNAQLVKSFKLSDGGQRIVMHAGRVAAAHPTMHAALPAEKTRLLQKVT